METKNDWDNIAAKRSQDYIDRNYLDMAPDKSMSTRKLFGKFAMTRVGVFCALFILLALLVLGSRLSAERRKKEQDKAKGVLKTFLCDNCGLAEDAYRIKGFYHWPVVIFEIEDRKYCFEYAEDGAYSTYLTAYFCNKAEKHLTDTLIESGLLKETELELVEVEVVFSGRGKLKGYLPVTLTPEIIERAFSTEPEALKDFVVGDTKQVYISGSIIIRSDEKYEFDEDRFSGILDKVYYLTSLSIKYPSGVSIDGKKEYKESALFPEGGPCRKDREGEKSD